MHLCIVISHDKLKISPKMIIRLKKIICVFQVSRPYLGFCHDPKHFMDFVNCEQNIDKYVER